MTSTDQWMPTSTPKIRPIRTLGFMNGSLARVSVRALAPITLGPGPALPKAARKPRE
jgi:hypothetical protein